MKARACVGVGLRDENAKRASARVGDGGKNRGIER